MQLQVALDAPTGDSYPEAVGQVELLTIDVKEKRVHIINRFYRSQADIEAGKAPLLETHEGAAGDDYEAYFSPAALSTDGVDPLTQAGKFLTERRTAYAGAVVLDETGTLYPKKPDPVPEPEPVVEVTPVEIAPDITIAPATDELAVGEIRATSADISSASATENSPTDTVAESTE